VEPGEFRGTIGRYHFESTPWWPERTRAPERAPNVVLVVLDDVGFAQLGCFGSDLATPTIDALAEGGLRYRSFHTTALCSPTRACLLTGRNHHVNGMGRVSELASGFPGYDGRIPRTNALLPEVLVPHGYAAWAVGKWHLTPEDETHQGASRARWPLGRGFERFYGFFEGETHQYAPALVHDNHRIAAPAPYDSGYHLTEDLTDHAIGHVRDLRMVDDEKPFFLYFAPGACHSPHQPPREYLDRYRGAFDEGWDVWRERTFARQLAEGLLPPHTQLSPRPDWVPAWTDLSADDQRLFARYMEAFAGFLTHTDEQLGRLVDALRQTGDLDNTLLMVLSDNGASSEGGPTGSLNDVRIWNGARTSRSEALARIDEIGGPFCHNNYPWGWTVAGNTPFRRWKRETHEGGVADPLIIHWPAGIAARGEVRHQYVHAIDLAPTLLDVIGIDPPSTVAGVAQRPLDGVSVAATFADAAAPEVHGTQFYEMFGCRALYHEGWMAVTSQVIQADDPPLDQAVWELYDLRADPSECHDLAADEPDRLEAMVERWWAEAERNQVLPLDNRPFSELVFDRISSVPPRGQYTYWPGRSPVPESVAVNVRGRAHTISAHLTVPPALDVLEGVLAVQGSVLGGWSFHLLADGRLCYVHNLAGWRLYRVEADIGRLTPGDHVLACWFTPPVAELLVDGVVVGTGEIRRTIWSRFSLTGAGLTAGWAPDFSPADGDYRGHFECTATLHKVVIDVAGDPEIDPEQEAQDLLSSQ
jgi:arylsulfatase